MPVAERLEELAADLDRVAESFADVAMDVLRQAMSEQTPEAADAAKKTERVINRARTSVEKAARLVRKVAADETDSESEW